MGTRRGREEQRGEDREAKQGDKGMHTMRGNKNERVLPRCGRRNSAAADEWPPEMGTVAAQGCATCIDNQRGQVGLRKGPSQFR